MKEIEFKPEHLEVAEIIGQDADLCTEENLAILASHPSSTFVADGRVIACAGIAINEDRVGMVWLLPTKYLSQNFIGVSRGMKYYVTHLPAVYRLTKLVTAGHDDSKVIRWLNWLGFHYDEETQLYVKGL